MDKRNCLIKYDLVLFLMSFLLFIGLFSDGAAAVQEDRPSSIIKLPENENVILVEKKTQTLFIYTLKSETLSIDFKTACSTGEAYGVKEKAGDRKTPEGIYFLLDEYEDRYSSPIYGIKAFPTDYPNLIDKRSGKNGSAIWIHGTNKELKPMDSNGCVALENSNIQTLSNYITLNSTPVIMVEEIKMVKKKIISRQNKKISELLAQWVQTIEKGSYHAYLSFYSPEYVPDITWWEQWLEIRHQSDKLKIPFQIKTEQMGVYYHNNIFVVLFDYVLSAENKKVFVGKRKLFIQNGKNDYKIIGDSFQTVSKEFGNIENPFIAGAKTIVKPVKKENSVLETVKLWLSAWSAKDMDTYASFYADNFYSDGKNKNRWVQKKRILAKKYDFINVTGRDFKIKQKKNACEVSFFQEYESSGLTTNGTKRLKLVKKGGLWKIYQESWKEK